MDRHPRADRYKDQWETGVMAAAVSAMASLDPDERQALLKRWIIDSYNGASSGIAAEAGDFTAAIEWAQSGPTHFDLLYEGPFGMKLSLGRAYQQPNGTWAAMVIAGVKDELEGAMASAEWAISRLCS